MFFSVQTYEAQNFFFNANYLNWLLTSPVILDTHAAVEPRYNHTIWQNSWTTIIGQYSAHCLSLDFVSECLQRRKKSLFIFVLDTKTKEDDKIVLQSVGFEISRERQGLLLQSRKMAKRWQSFWKTHTARSSFTSFLLSGASFLGRKAAKQATNSRPVPRHIKIGPRTFLKVYLL